MALSSAPPITRASGGPSDGSETRAHHALATRKALGRRRGRKPPDRRGAELAALRRRTERTEAELEKAEKVIEVHGNVSALLGRMTGRDGIATG